MALVWIATAPIYAAPAVRAFNRNDVVPDSVVAALKLESTGLVVRAERKVATRDWRGTDPVTQAELEQLTETGRLSETALRAAFVPRWQPDMVYAADALVLSPTGQIIQAMAGFTSGSSYDAANWAVVAGGATAYDTPTVRVLRSHYPFWCNGYSFPSRIRPVEAARRSVRVANVGTTNAQVLYGSADNSNYNNPSGTWTTITPGQEWVDTSGNSAALFLRVETNGQNVTCTVETEIEVAA